MTRELRNVLYGFQRDFGGEVTEYLYKIDGFGIRLERVNGTTIKDIKEDLLSDFVLHLKGYDEWRSYKRDCYVDFDWAYPIYYNEIKNYFMEKGVKSLVDQQIEEYF